MNHDIFLYFKKETLSKMLTSFNSCTGLPIRILDSNGNAIISAMGNTTFCKQLQSFESHQTICRNVKAAIGKKTAATQKSFITSCIDGLHSLVIPHTQSGCFICTILVGPFLFQAPNPYFVADLLKSAKRDTREIIELHHSLETIPIIPESLLPSIEDLLCFLFHLPPAQTASAPKTYRTQDKPFQNYNDGSAYPYEKEMLLISQIKSGNLQKANAILNDLLGYVLFSQNSSLDAAKSRMIELCCVLSRVTIENGATTSGVLNFNNECIKSIQTITDIYDLGGKLQEITEVFITSIRQQQQQSENDSVEMAKSYISGHYSQPLALEELANYVHLSPSYFSSLFKQTLGTSFKSYLNIIRIENSKSMLSSTKLSLTQISAAAGFQDYNYFSKVFKNQVGMTPSEYRNHSRIAVV